MAYHYRKKEQERRQRERERKVRRIKLIFGIDAALVLVLLLILAVSKGMSAGSGEKETSAKAGAAGTEAGQDKDMVQNKTEDKTEKKDSAGDADKASDTGGGEKADEPVTITVSAAGDCTLGTDEFFDWSDSLPAKYEEVGDPAYFFRNVQPIFAEDDLTIVNFEGTLTESEEREDKQFAFKAAPAYAEILTAGSVEAANMANNHSKDYGEQSYTDTIKALEDRGITTFGYDRLAVMDIKGVKVGLLGTYVLREGLGIKDSMIANLESLKEQGAQIIIASFHWGSEKAYEPDSTQIELAHAAIDNGADLVLGHHPHVLEGIEEYQGKNIVYSLGNFCFGGNAYPSDMNTMIFQQTFTIKDGELQQDNVKNIIPCRISSEDGYNNYQPTPAEGEQKDDILQKIEEYSSWIQG
ncbi:Capsule biosynthesis protein CapA [Blautia producta]|uniref:Capsule biosynthesis protein CapA n=1 Tax=Blautia producta TaxID=33035 RepID=A0A4P6LXG5_9FIRM|nr:CapA family protein [Blautia producta]QBE95833.1 Capsule biosynthesis protein CapA [Blautia producta]